VSSLRPIPAIGRRGDRALLIVPLFRVAIGKRVTPHQSTWTKPGKHHFAFVDLASEEAVQAAIKALNGMTWQGSRLRVNVSKSIPRKIQERGVPYSDVREPVGEPTD